MQTPEVKAILPKVDKINYLTIPCEVCERMVSIHHSCDHSKNGYCGKFRLEAARDMAAMKRKYK